MSNDNPLGVPAHRHRNPNGTEGGWEHKRCGPVPSSDTPSDERHPGPCPYIATGDEGTSHCSLAESRPAPVERPQPDEVSPDA